MRAEEKLTLHTQSYIYIFRITKTYQDCCILLNFSTQHYAMHNTDIFFSRLRSELEVYKNGDLEILQDALSSEIQLMQSVSVLYVKLDQRNVHSPVDQTFSSVDC